MNTNKSQDCSKCGGGPSCLLFPRGPDGTVLLPPPQAGLRDSRSTNLGANAASHPHYSTSTQGQQVCPQPNPPPKAPSQNGQNSSPEMFIVQSTKNQTYKSTASSHPLQVRMYCVGK